MDSTSSAPLTLRRIVSVGLLLMAVRAVMLVAGSVPIFNGPNRGALIVGEIARRSVEIIVSLPFIVLMGSLALRESPDRARSARWFTTKIGWGLLVSITHPVSVYYMVYGLTNHLGIGRPSRLSAVEHVLNAMPDTFMIYAAVDLVIDWMQAQRRLTVTARRTTELERAAADAQMEALRGRLEPHFLYNALNAIGDAAFESAEKANELLRRLAALLRASLADRQTREVPLSRELEILDDYVQLQRERFGDRFGVSVEAPAEVMTLMVPPFLLLPLVENAVQHGGAGSESSHPVMVRAGRTGNALTLTVQDRGNAPPGAPGFGVGLAATRERLQLLYGSEASLDAGHDAHGGFRVAISIPITGGEDAEHADR